MNLVLKVENISHRWNLKSELIYENLNCSLNNCDKILLEGRSGSGKTTLLKTSAGILAPLEGKVAWGEYSDIYALPDRKRTLWRRAHIGYLNQDSTMLPNLTICENIACALPGRPSQEDKNRISGLLDLLGISHLAKMYPSHCSGGERQRAGVARALAKKPQLLILDEPTASLDTKSAYRVLALLEQVVQQGTAVLVSSHDPLVKDWADTCLNLSDFQKFTVEQDDPSHLTASHRLENP